MYYSYSLRRTRWFRVRWHWEVEHQGAVCKRGTSLSKAAARWAARTFIRSQRKRMASESDTPLRPLSVNPAHNRNEPSPAWPGV
jgi:hypothetical protein